MRYFLTYGLSEEVATWVIRNPKAAINVMVKALMKVSRPLHIIPQPKEKIRLVPWKSIQSGGFSPHKLIANMDEDRISKDARAVLSVSPRLKTRGTVDLVVLDVGQLHFDEFAFPREFMSKNFCSMWSSKFLDRQAIELCANEDAAEFCIQHPNCYFIKPIHFVKEPVLTQDDRRRWLFEVEHNSQRGCCLGVGEVIDGERWTTNRMLVFRLVDKK